MNSCYQLCDHRAGPDHSYLMQNLTGVGKGKGLNIGHWRKWTPVTHMKCNPFNSQGISRVFEWDIILGQDNKGKWALLLLCSIVCICRDTPQPKKELKNIQRLKVSLELIWFKIWTILGAYTRDGSIYHSSSEPEKNFHPDSKKVNKIQ